MVGVACLGLATWLLIAAPGVAFAKANHSSAAKATVINVTAGKPSELAFELSKQSMIPVGTVTFKVTDGGLAYHDLEICTAPVKTAKNSCAGKATKILHPGQSATLTVNLKKGVYEFLCSVPGHAAAGMKGLIGVGVPVKVTTKQPSKVTTPPAATTTTTSSTTPPASTTTTTATATPPPGGGDGGGASACPGGETVQQNDQNTGSLGDRDGDDNGGADDNDGCL
jgi:uncharacterized cupredoxin-like copper-binding protein